MRVPIVPIKYVDASVLGRCPAAVDMQTGVISVNRSVWHNYDNFEKAFVIMHEIGHYVLDTDSEYEADAYALRHVYKTAPRSLKRSLQTLCKIRVIDHSRLDNLYKEALKLDAADGNEIAGIELQQISSNNQFFNQNSETMTKNSGQETYPMKRQRPADVRIVRRADGDKCGHGMNGIHIGDWYFSITNLLLAAIVVILVTKK